MRQRFTGSIEDLQGLLTPLTPDGEWLLGDTSHFQFRHRNGGVLNWYPSTGTINFQGKAGSKLCLQQQVESLLTDASTVQDAVQSQADDVGSTMLPERALDGSQSSAPLSPVVPPAGVVSTNKSFQTSSVAAAHTESTSRSCTALSREGARDSELIIGLVGAVGAQLDRVSMILKDRLKQSGYAVKPLRVSQDIIPIASPASAKSESSSEHERIRSLIAAGDNARKQSGDNSVLALGAAAWISSKRVRDRNGQPQPQSKTAYVVSSLKHPAEVARLRQIYPLGFYLIGVYEDGSRRHNNLEKDKGIKPAALIADLMKLDEDEELDHGQRVTATFHLSDFFVRIDGDDDQLKCSLGRIVDILFGHPYQTPTFDEYAMFLAFAASLRSADLSRQVGAVIARGCDVLATGANDCPRAGGGLYWPEYDPKAHRIVDAENGRDYMRGEDPNKAELQLIMDDIICSAAKAGIDESALRKALEESRIGDLTEFGRVVHAEMEALLSCARGHVSAQDATLYCTTFPCHNCAKHLVAAGIKRVVFVEPYQKSKAFELHSDAIRLGFSKDDHGATSKVAFEPFVGVGPRRFFELFSMKLGTSIPLKRKNADGQVVDWRLEDAALRAQMLPHSYLDLELVATSMFQNSVARISQGAAQ